MYASALDFVDFRAFGVGLTQSIADIFNVGDDEIRIKPHVRITRFVFVPSADSASSACSSLGLHA